MVKEYSKQEKEEWCHKISEIERDMLLDITEKGKSHDLEVYLANYNINERQQWIDMIANLILLHLECLKETN